MDAETIGAAAAVEAFKQTAAQHQAQPSSVAGAFKPTGAQRAKPTSANENDSDSDEAPEEAVRNPFGGGGIKDTIVRGVQSTILLQADEASIRWPLRWPKLEICSTRRMAGQQGAMYRERTRVSNHDLLLIIRLLTWTK